MSARRLPSGWWILPGLVLGSVLLIIGSIAIVRFVSSGDSCVATQEVEALLDAPGTVEL